MQQLLPEWHLQEAVLLSWPDAKTDWQPWLSHVRQNYLDIIAALNSNDTPVIMLIRQNEIADCQSLVSSANNINKLLLVPADYNDTWIRDYGFLTCQDDDLLKPVSFNFNGWGNKFNANKDNQMNEQVLAKLCQHPLESVDFVLEGGAVEIDDSGHLFTTELCLSNPERNGQFEIEKNQQILQQALGANKVTIFKHGHLEGDDTDGHIDTLVRYTPDNGLVIQSCLNRPQDPHFDGLSALVAEAQLQLPGHEVFELPLPYLENDESERLPASYANYLINNGQILAPVYGEPEDEQAIEVLKTAYPNYKIVAINCRPLIQQFGSLHCISMQVPCGTLKPEITQLANSGMTIYEQN